MDEQRPHDVSVRTITCEAAIAMVCDSPWGIAIVSKEGYFEFVNAAYCNVLGCSGSPSLVVGTHYRTWTHPEDIAEDERMAEQVKSGELPGYIFKKRYRVRGPAGRYRWGILSVVGVWESDVFLNYQVQFLPLDEATLPQSQWNAAKLKSIALWLWENRKTAVMVVVTAASIFSALTARNWDALSQALEPIIHSPKSESLPQP